MFRLRGNFVTNDIRLDRIPYFDEKSKQYRREPRFGLSAFRGTVIHRCDIHLNQGREGACVGAGLTHALLGMPGAIPNLDMEYARSQVYWPAQKIDPWDGGSYPGAEPQYEGTATLAGIEVLRRLGWIDGYFYCFGIDEVMEAIVTVGGVVLGIPWMSGMMYPDNTGFIRATGKVDGHHCIWMKGANFTDKYGIVHNSWGPSWGKGGDAALPFEDLKILLALQGEAVVLVNKHNIMVDFT